MWQWHKIKWLENSHRISLAWPFICSFIHSHVFILCAKLVGYPQKKINSYSLVAHMVKNLPTIRETQVQSLSWEGPLEKGIATHSSILAWRTPWTEEPGRLQSMGLQRVRHDWSDGARHDTPTFGKPTYTFPEFSAVGMYLCTLWTPLEAWLF